MSFNNTSSDFDDFERFTYDQVSFRTDFFEEQHEKYFNQKSSVFCEIAIAMTLFYFFATLFFQSSLKNSTVCFFANSYFDQHVLSKTRDSWEVPVLLGRYCKIVAPSNPQYPPQKNEESWTNITKTNRLHPCLAEQKIIFVLWKIVRGAFSPSFKGRRFYLVLYINELSNRGR